MTHEEYEAFSRRILEGESLTEREQARMAEHSLGCSQGDCPQAAAMMRAQPGNV